MFIPKVSEPLVMLKSTKFLISLFTELISCTDKFFPNEKPNIPHINNTIFLS